MASLFTSSCLFPSAGVNRAEGDAVWRDRPLAVIPGRGRGLTSLFDPSNGETPGCLGQIYGAPRGEDGEGLGPYADGIVVGVGC